MGSWVLSGGALWSLVQRALQSPAFPADDEAMGGAEPPLNKQALLYCERGVELLTDLLSQLPTRRFVHTLLEDKAVLIKCKLSALHSQLQGVHGPFSGPTLPVIFKCLHI